MAFFIDHWPYLLTTKLSYAQLFMWGYSNVAGQRWSFTLFFQTYLIACMLNTWSEKKIDVLFIGSLVVMGWFLPLLTIGFCYRKVLRFLFKYLTVTTVNFTDSFMRHDINWVIYFSKQSQFTFCTLEFVDNSCAKKYIQFCF